MHETDIGIDLLADIVERYQLSLMLTVIAIRNIIEMAGSDFAFLPKSFIRGKGSLETILSVSCIPPETSLINSLTRL